MGQKITKFHGCHIWRPHFLPQNAEIEYISTGVDSGVRDVVRGEDLVVRGRIVRGRTTAELNRQSALIRVGLHGEAADLLVPSPRACTRVEHSNCPIVVEGVAGTRAVYEVQQSSLVVLYSGFGSYFGKFDHNSEANPVKFDEIWPKSGFK